jgi:hypothetical protein
VNDTLLEWLRRLYTDSVRELPPCTYVAPLDPLSARARQLVPPPTAGITAAVYAGTPVTQTILARNFDLLHTLLIDYGLLLFMRTR